MPWGAAIAAVGAYAASQSSSDAAEDNSEAQIKAQKELTELKRQYQLEDRKYNQDAVGAWSKYLDPRLSGAAAAAGTPGATSATSSDNGGSPVTDPNDPRFAPNATAPGSNALPINHPAPFAGMQLQNGQAPKSLWYTAPAYVPYKPQQ